MDFNKYIQRLLCLVLILAAFPQWLQSQVNVDTAFVEKFSNITVADALKIMENPVNNDSVPKQLKPTYSIFSNRANTIYEPSLIKPALMKGEPLTKLYNGLVKAGYGTYNTPFAEAFYNNLRSKTYNYGVRLKHFSSAGKINHVGYPGFSDNEAEAYGKYYLKAHTLDGNLYYYRNAVHQYGYNTDLHNTENDFTRQRFNNITPQFRVISHFNDSDMINYNVLGKYHYIEDINGTYENSFLADGLFKRYIPGGELLKANVSIDHYNRKNELDTNLNTIVKLFPQISTGGDKWNAAVGINANIEWIRDSTFYHFYPHLEASYNIYNNIMIPYTSISGGMQANSFRSIVLENPFIISSPEIRNTSKKFDILGGLKGSLSAETSYNLNASYASYHNMLFFVTDKNKLLLNVFKPVYDNIKLVTLHGEIGFQRGEKLRILAAANYYKYNMEKEAKPWNKPTYDFTLSSNYNLQQKIIVKADMYFIGGRYARLDTGNFMNPGYSQVMLKAMADLNIGVEYRYTKLLSGFVNFNNIAAMRYYRWYGYPSQRFNLIAGVTYSF